MYKKKFDNEKDYLLSKIEPLDNGCWIWRGNLDKDGYGKGCYQFKHWRAHRKSYELFKGKFKSSLHVCHTCDNPSCVNPDHLWVGTNVENINDKIHKGRQIRGEQVGNSKLTVEMVLDIRKNYKGYPCTKVFAKKYNVAQTTVWEVFTRKTWRHI